MHTQRHLRSRTARVGRRPFVLITLTLLTGLSLGAHAGKGGGGNKGGGGGGGSNELLPATILLDSVRPADLPHQAEDDNRLLHDGQGPYIDALDGADCRIGGGSIFFFPSSIFSSQAPERHFPAQPR